MGAGEMVSRMRRDVFGLAGERACGGQACECVKNVRVPKTTGQCLADDAFPDQAWYQAV